MIFDLSSNTFSPGSNRRFGLRSDCGFFPRSDEGFCLSVGFVLLSDGGFCPMSDDGFCPRPGCPFCTSVITEL